MPMLQRRLTIAAVAVALAAWTVSVPAQSGPAGRRWVATWGTALQLVRLPAPGAGGRGQAPAAGAPTSAAGTATTPPPAPKPTPPTGPARRFGIPPPIAGINDQTVRMIVRTSTGGDEVRVRLWNAFGAAPVSIGAAHIAMRGTDSSIVTSTGRPLTFNGKPTVTLTAGQILVSDPVSLKVQPLADVAVSLYVANDAGVPTGHTFGLRPTYVSRTGNYASATSIDNIAVTTQSYYWLAGLDVLTRAEAARS